MRAFREHDLRTVAAACALLLAACEAAEPSQDDAASTCGTCEAGPEADGGADDGLPASRYADGGGSPNDCGCDTDASPSDGSVDSAWDGAVLNDTGNEEASVEAGMDGSRSDAADGARDAAFPQDDQGGDTAALDTSVHKDASDASPGAEAGIGDTGIDGATGDSVVAEDGGSGADPSLACGFRICPAGSKSDFRQWSSLSTACVPDDQPEFSCADPTDSSPCVLARATATCRSGACAVATCAAGYDDCDDLDSNGCEADLRSTSHCGSCGHACGDGQLCANGDCVAQCPFPLTNCGGACVNLSNSIDHCGACPTVCTASPGSIAQCIGGTCQATPNPNGASCNGTDLQSDPRNCGTCGHECHGTFSSLCIDGACACSAGYTLCSDYCIDLQRDRANCGECGHICDGTSRCDGGQCVPATSQRLAAGSDIESIATDADYVYFTDSGDNSVRRVPKAGGETTLIADTQARPLAVLVDASHVYWASNLGGAILRAAKGGGEWAVVTNASSPGHLTADQDRLYWINSDSTIRTVRKDGSDSRIIAKSVFGTGPLLVDDNYVYFGNSLSFTRVAKTSQDPAGCGACKTIVGCEFVDGTAQDAENVYVGCTPSSPDISSALWRVPKNGTQPRSLLARLSGNLFMNGCFLWVGRTRISVEGAGAIAMDIGADTIVTSIGGTDSTYVYWRSRNGIYRSRR